MMRHRTKVLLQALIFAAGSAQAGELTIMDGGMGRELARIGAPFSLPLWSAQALMEAPHYVTQAHQNFIDAGAEVITTNSYACVPFHMGEEAYQAQGPQLAEKSAQLAAEVAAKAAHKVTVAGSLPPPFGSYRPDWFEPARAKVVYQQLFDAQAPYVDAWIAETMASLAEFDVAHSVMKASDKPRYYSFTLTDDLDNGSLLRSGESVKEAAQAVADANGDAILFNCSVPEVMAAAIQTAKAVFDERKVDIEVGAYANSFVPIGKQHWTNNSLTKVRDIGVQEYLNYAQQWHELGATMIGGCCGIHPEHIATLSQWHAFHDD